MKKQKYDGYHYQKATLPAEEVRGVNIKHRREDHFSGQYTVVNPKTRKELAVLRIYVTNSLHTACLWVYGASTYCNGSGRAGGWGYHRSSAAASEAFDNAGIKLAKKDFGGMGDGAIEAAMLALGTACGCRKPWLLKAHG